MTITTNTYILPNVFIILNLIYCRTSSSSRTLYTVECLHHLELYMLSNFFIISNFIYKHKVLDDEEVPQYIMFEMMTKFDSI
jgi:hypothetical protein